MLRSFHASALADWLRNLSAWLAIFGGGALALLVCLTAASVAGRALFATPINGDFEIVEMGCAIALFYFLPWTQLRRGHIAVLLPQGFIPKPIAAGLRALGRWLGDLLFLLLALLLLNYLPRGGLGLLISGETTIVLGIPLWWPYLAALPALLVLGAVNCYCFYQSCQDLRHALNPSSMRRRSK